jgi:hypothetical protein
MKTEILCAVIGVVGTLVGTILGFFLSIIQTNTGDVKINISNFKTHFLDWNDRTYHIFDDCKDYNFPDVVHYDFDMSVYNEKNIRCSLSDFTVEIYNNGKKGRFPMLIADEFFNMEPREFRVKEMSGKVWLDNVDKINSSQKIKLFMRYRINNKKRVKHIKLK